MLCSSSADRLLDRKTRTYGERCILGPSRRQAWGMACPGSASTLSHFAFQACTIEDFAGGSQTNPWIGALQEFYLRVGRLKSRFTDSLPKLRHCANGFIIVFPVALVAPAAHDRAGSHIRKPVLWRFAGSSLANDRPEPFR